MLMQMVLKARPQTVTKVELEKESKLKENNSLVRTCIGCKSKKLMTKMMRFKIYEGQLVIGIGSRGAWLCKGSPDCIKLALKTNAFDKAFKCKVEVTAEDINVLVHGR